MGKITAYNLSHIQPESLKFKFHKDLILEPLRNCCGLGCPWERGDDIMLTVSLCAYVVFYLSVVNQMLFWMLGDDHSVIRL